ncbi:hypothetical protein BIW11_09740 [Tropilaelaps mercedesae]|uniref:Uncharacterized protein n=1 Tax=Tropilaelaps mercedesae TaxID=418985 RepID=A0A1V9XIT9_9ACAR|nr:hypothetical protein BIW11_09740 [Tropilaelaps mercedesae]
MVNCSFIAGGFMVLGANARFDVDQFRANAASIVVDMSNHFQMLQPFVALQLPSMPFGEQAGVILDEFFKTLPQFRSACHLGPAEPNYSLQKFFTDITDNLPAIAKHYDRLQKKRDKSLEDEKKCLSEHVISFVVGHIELAQTVLKFMKVVSRMRDEL